MYFVNIFSVAAILGWGFGRPGGGIWCGGLAAAALSIFTMASGFLAAMAVIGLVVLRALKQRRMTRGQIVTIVGGAAVIALAGGSRWMWRGTRCCRRIRPVIFLPRC